jgi:preprotein translocase subunit SecF
MGQRKWAALFSIILFVASMASFVGYGLNLGLDFTGGTQIMMHFDQPANLSAITEELSKAGYPQAVVTLYGSSRDVAIRLAPKDVSQQALTNQVKQAVHEGTINSVEFIGPQVGKTLVYNGILAIIISLLGTMIYVAMRFDWRFAVSATIALIHDPVLVLGIFSFFHLGFDLITLAAVLTVIGYSLNDTIVVYDRVRENFRKLRKGAPLEIMNISINETLSRTIMTSGLTLLVVVALFIYGGEVLRGFALALIIGIVVGTYSSIYVAGSLAILLGLDRASLVPAPRKEVDALP